MAEVYYATSNAGKFRNGQVYLRAQLGVLGRMAIRAGVLIPYEDAVPVTRKKSAPKKRLSQTQRLKRGWADGATGDEAGGGEGVRNDPGTQVGSVDDSGDQPAS